MRKIVINGESTSQLPPQPGIGNSERGTWTQYLVNSGKLQNDTITNLAEGGKKIQTIRSAYTNLDRTYSPSPNAGDTNGNGFYFLFGCANDIIYDRLATDIYADLVAIWGASRKYGFLVVAFTVMPATAAWFQGGKQQIATDLNAMIRADPKKYDYLIEVDTVITNAYDTTMLVDGLHTTPRGAKAIFDLVEQGPLAFL